LSFLLPPVLLAQGRDSTREAVFEVTFPRTAHEAPLTGRVFVAVARSDKPEPRLQAGSLTGSPFFGVDVSGLRAGAAARVSKEAVGYPFRSLESLPPGDYWVQAFLTVYTEFHRSDGHTLWAHDDQWEGQQFNDSPGTLVSTPQHLHLDPHAGFRVRLDLTRVLPPVAVPPR
jgi:hypothetical protein